MALDQEKSWFRTLVGPLRSAKRRDEFKIRALRATFEDRATERDFEESRRADDARATALALLGGGLAYAGAGVTDAGVFASAPEVLPYVWGLRTIGVSLCLGGAAVVWIKHKIVITRVCAVIAMLGTLMTYCGIAYLEETRVGSSDFRMVFSVFSLLAFIFFPLPVVVSAAMVVWMMITVAALSASIGLDRLIELRTLALMLTFAIAGGSFSVMHNRARRKEYALRKVTEETMAELSREVERRRTVEIELQQHQEGLEQAVRIRTEELRKSERQLIASQRMEAVGQLAGGLAHDFNNLLTVVMGNAELTLRRSDLPPPAAELQRDIRGAAERASALARDLLMFSRREVMALSTLCLTELIEKMASILRAALGGHLQLDLELSQDTPLVRGSSGPLEQMILNLVINARDATKPGGRIVVQTAAQRFDEATTEKDSSVPAGDYARITVTDTGVGIDPSHLDRIFEPFFSTKPEGIGTGLGLSVVHGIVRQHGGFIKVSSKLGQGSSFDVYLPAVTGDLPIAKAEPASRSMVGAECILVVDDEPMVLKLAERTLRLAGYTVLSAPDAETALELFRTARGKIDLVISDLMMPGTNGRELMERLTSDGFEASFIFVSGYADGGIHRGFILEEGITLLKKPYDLDEMLATVRAALDRKRTVEPAPTA